MSAAVDPKSLKDLVVAELELPGFSPAQLKLELVDGGSTLLLDAGAKLRRAITLPRRIHDMTAAHAYFMDGILRITASAAALQGSAAEAVRHVGVSGTDHAELPEEGSAPPGAAPSRNGQ